MFLIILTAFLPVLELTDISHPWDQGLMSKTGTNGVKNFCTKYLKNMTWAGHNIKNIVTLVNADI